MGSSNAGSEILGLGRLKVGQLRSLLGLASAISIAALQVGCGGGGSSSPPSGTGGPSWPAVDTTKAYTSSILGTVTDGNSGAIVGATVTFPGYAPVSTSQFGLFEIPNVVVPVGQVSVIGSITAAATVNGKPWSGQNTVTVLRTNASADNSQITLSLTSAQGSITGTVTDSSTHKAIVGAQVFAADGPYTGGTAPSTFQYFSVSAAYTAYTNSSGSYQLAALPPITKNYTVTVTAPGYKNQILSNIVVASGKATTGVNLSLQPILAGVQLPVVTGLTATTITAPTVPTRAAANLNKVTGVEAIKYSLLKRLGALSHSVFNPNSITIKRSITRGAPSGSEIESIVIWDYAPITNLLGYDILRSTTAINKFNSIAVVTDPLGDRYADDDPALTPDTTYYYSVARLDTVSYFTSGDEGAAATPPAAVSPLGALNLTAPVSGASVVGAPAFAWTPVNRATTYTVYVYSQFPTYQSDTAEGSAVPVWSASTSGTTLQYAGTGPAALQSGSTYYWVVLAQDSVVTDFSISPIQSFIAQ